MFSKLRHSADAVWARRPGFLRGRGLYFVSGAAALVLALGWVMLGGKDDADPYRTAAIDRGAITRVVSATGTLQPLVSAEVGSTVSGPVLSVEVDFNAQVRANQVLARLDPSSFQQRVAQALATLSQTQAQLAVAESDYQRYARLQERGFASEQLISQQRAARATARAAVAQASASLASARTDLARTIIRSPIDGVVVDRKVNVGQSVAASFQAPTLFVIAQDLSRLQANIIVDEADIGEVREGMDVRFSVDAFPDRAFEGRVAQVRQQGVSDQGVVSYIVVVQADNPERQLLPGMTANAEIVIEQRDDVLRAPNAALRFRPADPEIAARGQAMTAEAAPGGRGAERGGGGQRRGVDQLAQSLELNEAQTAAARQAFQNAMQAGQRPGSDAAQGERRAFMRRIRDAAVVAIEPTLSAHQRDLLRAMREGARARRDVRQPAVIWVLRNNRPVPVRVEIGVADNGYTLLHAGLEAGAEVIVGGGPQPAQRNNPFGGGGRGPGGARIRGA
jgi:HlyD family secretion protein